MLQVSRVIAGVLVSLGSLSAAQDPIATLPEAYKIQFENEWVRVVRVHYDAGARLAEHTHPAGTTAYVYLNDSDGVVFRHSGKSHHVVTRPPVKAGSVRVASGDEETHTAENPSPAASDFLRLQFKTESGGERRLRRRIARGSYPIGENATGVEFTNGQMRITRIIVAPGRSLDIQTAVKEPALLVALSPARLAIAGGSSQDIPLAAGQERWIDERRREVVSNTGSNAVELLRFDLLTPPR